MLDRRPFRALACLPLLAGLASAANLPRESPEFVINTNSGKQILLSQYRGKVVVLAFILTTCPHCQKTVGILSKLQTEFGPRGFQVLASAIESAAPLNVPGFVKRFQPTFPVGFNDYNPVLDYLQHPVMLRLMMPQVVFIDRKGVIRAQYSGDDKFFEDDKQENNIRAQIETLLKEGPVAKKRHTRASSHGKAQKRG
jgi:peroxiredoxin